MKFLALVTCLTFLPVATRAQEFIPKWHMTGNEACYDLEGAKLLLKTDIDFKECKSQAAQVPKLERANSELKLALDIQQKHAELWADQSMKYNTELTRKILEVYKCEAKINSGPSWGWLVAGGLALTLVGIGIGAWVKPAK